MKNINETKNNAFNQLTNGNKATHTRERGPCQFWHALLKETTDLNDNHTPFLEKHYFGIK